MSIASNFIPGAWIEKAGGRFIEKLGGKLLVKVSGKAEETIAKLVEKGLNPEQIRNYKDFTDKIAKGKVTNVYHLPNGGKAFEAILPSNNKQSYTVWEKYLNAKGETKILGHRTHLNDGTPIHWHEKLPSAGREINLRNTTGKPYVLHMQQLLKHHEL